MIDLKTRKNIKKTMRKAGKKFADDLESEFLRLYGIECKLVGSADAITGMPNLPFFYCEKKL